MACFLEAGENKAYTIDYNLSEITFNTTFPITNDMRIWIEFQYSDRNYTRIITYEEVNYSSEKLNVSGYFYSENDAKNQPLQQVLSEKQKQILANAGNNTDLMFSESAFIDTYNENKVLYKKVVDGGNEVFEYSTDATELELLYGNIYKCRDEQWGLQPSENRSFRSRFSNM